MQILGDRITDLAVYATCANPGQSGRGVVLWHHGSPQTGDVIAPVAAAAAAAGLDVLSIARPGYGGSARKAGRDVASVATSARTVLDHLGIGDVFSVGASGGGPHALACAAIMPDRVRAVVTFASPSPFSPDTFWYEGMQDPAGLRAGSHGARARMEYVAQEQFDAESFVPSDWDALETRWASLGDDVAAASAFGPAGLVDDDVALTHPWGFELSTVAAPVWLYQGGQDRVIPQQHASALAAALKDVRLRIDADAGHVSILDHLGDALQEITAGRPAR
jgi:pimeloyl-ACP methyl ester carboxylesterase